MAPGTAFATAAARSTTPLVTWPRTDVYLGVVVMIRKKSVILCVAALATFFCACGGGQAGPGAHSPGESGEADGEGAGLGESGARGTPESRCADDACFVCGEGLCPRGYYCDGDASGGPACGWLPECAQKATCDCVTGVLGASCRCEERDGGVFVECS